MSVVQTVHPLHFVATIGVGGGHATAAVRRIVLEDQPLDVA